MEERDDETEPQAENYALSPSERPDQPKALKVIMPKAEVRTISAATGYVLEVAKVVLDAKKALEGTEKVVIWLSGKTLATHFIAVAAGDFLDTTLIEALATLGDTTYAAAVDVLEDARRASTTELKKRHRHTAEGQLRLAYRGYENALRNRSLAAEFKNPHGGIDLCARAAQMALLIALILSDIGDAEGVRRWQDRARENFSQYVTQQRARYARAQGVPMDPSWSWWRKELARIANTSGQNQAAIDHVIHGRAPVNLAELEEEMRNFQQVMTAMEKSSR